MSRPIALFSPMLSAAADALRSGGHRTGQRTAEFESTFRDLVAGGW
jgi:hypothetical protein